MEYLCRRRLELIEQVIDYFAAMISVYETERVQAAAIRVREAVASVFWQIGRHEVQRLFLMSLFFFKSDQPNDFH
jgi:hypothetical protein